MTYTDTDIRHDETNDDGMTNVNGADTDITNRDLLL